MEVANLERSHKGYHSCGSAESFYGKSRGWCSVASVTLLALMHSLIQIYHYEDREITRDDEQLAAWFGLALACTSGQQTQNRPAAQSAGDR